MAGAPDRSHPTGMAMPILSGSHPSYSTAIPSHIDWRTQSCAVSDLRVCRVKIRGSENCIFLSQSLLMSLSSFIWPVIELLRGDYKKSEYGKAITVNRHFGFFKPPRSLEEIDAGPKDVTAKIVTMLEGLAE